MQAIPDSKVHGANMGPTWVLSAPDGPHVGPMNLAIRVGTYDWNQTIYLKSTCIEAKVKKCRWWQYPIQPSRPKTINEAMDMQKWTGMLKLTHWGPRQMDAISQTTFSNAFSWMKLFESQLKFHWSLFPRVQLTIFQQWFRWWLGAVQATSHYLNQWWLVYRRIYVSLGLNELN